MDSPFTQYDALTFDCYGTLIDWEEGIGSRLDRWARESGLSIDRERLLELFARFESRLERDRPSTPYRDILRLVHGAIAAELGVASGHCADRETARGTEDGELDRIAGSSTAGSSTAGSSTAGSAAARSFAASVGDWPTFPDTCVALAVLRQHYKLVIISNVDRISFAGSARRLGIDFDAIVTAEQVGAYKPDHRMFERAFTVLEGMGVERRRILHVAQSLYHDHAPAQVLGMKTVWINRRGARPGAGATMQPPADVQPDLTLGSLAELADLASVSFPAPRPPSPPAR